MASLSAAGASQEVPAAKESFPRLMGMNITAKNYHDPVYQTRLARLDLIVLGFYRGWNPKNAKEPIRDVVRSLKRRNPRLIVGQYTILSTAYEDVPKNATERDKAQKLNSEDWWLRKADGRKVQWQDTYGAWETNITTWPKPDANGLRYPEWAAQREYDLYFGPTPEFDIWYLDNVFVKPGVPVADWNRDGRDDSRDSEEIASATRKGYLAYLDKIRRLAPGTLVMANAEGDFSNPDYRGRFGAAFLEGMIGKSWSPEHVQGWRTMMDRYHAAMRNTAAPHIVGFGVAGHRDDYRLLRYGLASCLMDDGYFAYSDIDRGYSGVLWFDEYDVNLGRPLTPPPASPWENGVYRRDFENGIALVNPTLQTRQVTVGPNLRRINGTQDPDINSGQSVSSLTIPSKDGIVLVRSSALTR
jgi:hypothetical protein